MSEDAERAGEEACVQALADQFVDCAEGYTPDEVIGAATALLARAINARANGCPHCLARETGYAVMLVGSILWERIEEMGETEGCPAGESNTHH